MKILPKIIIIFLEFFLLSLTPSNKVSAQSCSPVFPSNECEVSNSVTITANVPESSVTFSGFAPNGSVLTFKEDDLVVGTTITNSESIFTKTIATPSGIHSYTVYLTDTNGLSSPEISFFNIAVTNHTNTAITNIHMPPTISISKSNINSGETIIVSGQGPKDSTLHLYLNNKVIYSDLINSDSLWSFNLNTQYQIGENSLYANLTRTNADTSENSSLLKFTAEDCSNCPVSTPEPEENPPTTTPDPSTKKDYNVDINIGWDLGRNLTWILLTSLVTTQLILFLLIVFWWWRRKKKEAVLEELEQKVEKDLHLDNPQLRIEKDFWEAERKL